MGQGSFWGGHHWLATEAGLLTPRLCVVSGARLAWGRGSGEGRERGLRMHIDRKYIGSRWQNLSWWTENIVEFLHKDIWSPSSGERGGERCLGYTLVSTLCETSVTLQQKGGGRRRELKGTKKSSGHKVLCVDWIFNGACVQRSKLFTHFLCSILEMTKL